MIRNSLAIIVFAGMGAGRLASQPAEALLKGRVIDRGRAAVAGAGITAGARNGTGIKPTAVAGAQGEFSLPLPPGRYTITIAAPGFADLTETLDLDVNTAPREFELSLAPAHYAVTVRENAGYATTNTSAATKTLTPLGEVPQAITVVSREQIRDQMMMSIADVVRYVPGLTAHQGENNRDQVIIRGNSSSADFFVNGVRDDVQYYRDLYNVERVEAIKGPNAMIFGRGGGGGVINRVTKEADFTPLREITAQGGSFGNKRFAADFDQPLGRRLAFRLNGMYENSGSFRKYVDLERYGISPTLTIAPTTSTRITVGYEHLTDSRVADRGITSFQGRSAAVPIETYYGNPGDSRVRAGVNLGTVSLTHQAGQFSIRNRAQFGGYDKFYQNYVPGAVNESQTLVSLSSYNNATQRLNFFNQTDVSRTVMTGAIRHTLTGGAEVGRQSTGNFRNTGYFANTSTSLLVPFEDPTTATPVTFRQSATDARNHLQVRLGAAYVQDQVHLSRYLQLIAGLRVDQFDLRYLNLRANDALRRIDNLVSPRAGLVFKPAGPMSIYANYSVSSLPSAGDQFASLTTITQQAKPEKFRNYEAGVKWDVTRSLSLTTAIYRLDRTNTRATDPNDPTRIVQTGSQRTNGYEIGATGGITRKWQIAGGYAWQDAFVTSATTAARAGAQVGQVPHHVFSLWNNYRVLPRLGAGLGILNRTDMFAAIDNTVRLPGYTRADAALFVTLTERVRLQVNVENLFNRQYDSNADSNTNISPGFPRAFRLGLVARL